MRYRSIAVSLSILALAVLTSCGRKEPEQAATAPAENRGFDYTCTDGLKFNARIDRGNVLLTLDGKTLTLPPDTSASGAHYSGEGVTFIAQGREATLIRSGENARSCNTPQ